MWSSPLKRIRYVSTIIKLIKYINLLPYNIKGNLAIPKDFFGD